MPSLKKYNLQKSGLPDTDSADIILGATYLLQPPWDDIVRDIPNPNNGIRTYGFPLVTPAAAKSGHMCKCIESYFRYLGFEPDDDIRVGNSSTIVIEINTESAKGKNLIEVLDTSRQNFAISQLLTYGLSRGIISGDGKSHITINLGSSQLIEIPAHNQAEVVEDFFHRNGARVKVIRTTQKSDSSEDTNLIIYGTKQQISKIGQIINDVCLGLHKSQIIRYAFGNQVPIETVDSSKFQLCRVPLTTSSKLRIDPYSLALIDTIQKTISSSL